MVIDHNHNHNHDQEEEEADLTCEEGRLIRWREGFERDAFDLCCV